jgi:hypothetical protein
MVFCARLVHARIGFPVTTVSVFFLRSVVLVLFKSTNTMVMKIPGKIQGSS